MIHEITQLRQDLNLSTEANKYLKQQLLHNTEVMDHLRYELDDKMRYILNARYKFL